MEPIEKIMDIVQRAKTQETRNPEEAARLYLEAAQMLVYQNFEETEDEQKSYELAQKMYMKAKELQKRKGEKTSTARNVAAKTNKTGFDLIGGLEQLKKDIKLKIIEPLNNPELFAYYGKKMGGGILMYGPPGCGKTLIAKATAQEAQATFVHVKSSDLKSKFVGESERNIAELFTQAREKQPTILFFDEFEALGRMRSDSPVHEQNMVAQLLVEMDGMDTKDQQILLLAATNEPWAIDTALLREGRFGNTIFVPPPDIESRAQIFQLIMNKRPTEKLEYQKLAKITQNFSGADIKAACERATDIVLNETLDTGVKRNITMDDLRQAITTIKPALNVWFTKAQRYVKENKMEEIFSEVMENREENEQSEFAAS